MGLMSKKAEVKIIPNFNERLDKVKSMFTTAYNEASVLSSDMQASIDKDRDTIISIESRILDTEVTKAKVESYMNKLKDFI